MKILIGGDVSPINSNKYYFKENSEVFGELQREFEESDLNIVNLEVPLTNSSTKILKSGPNIKAPPFAAKTLKDSKVHLLSLANNHIGDFSKKGVLDTLKICKEHNINIVGAGLNINEAKKPVIIKSEKRIGVMSMSDTEFGIAKHNKPGANPLDICETTLQLLELKNKVDYCIVILHDGKEHYEYPSPNLQKICRYLCDIGADLVVCQHSHICGAWEIYKTANIFYGQGNVMFDYANRNSESWKTGFLIQIELSNQNVTIKQIPFKQTFPGIRKLNEQEEKTFFRRAEEMKKNVLDENFIKSSWLIFIKEYENLYYSIFRGYNRILRKLNSFLLISKFYYTRKDKAILLNIFRSRVHREIVTDILEKEVE